MKWIVKLVAETDLGRTVEQEVATLEREDLLSPATVGLTVAEGKTILEKLQRQMVAAQVQHHNFSLKSCFRCGRSFRTKGYYQSTLRSVYGNVPLRVRRIQGCSCTGIPARSYSTLPTSQNPITPELKYLTAKLAALLPFGEVTAFLSELLPLSAQTTTSTVRNRTMKMGKRLQKTADMLVSQPGSEPCREAVVGLDGASVRACHPRRERNFEIMVGKVLDNTGAATRFASVRNGGAEAAETTGRALRQHGIEKGAVITVLTDGDAGLRAIHRKLAPRAEHILDWFHISMRFQNLRQIAKGITGLTDRAIRRHILAPLERVKWRFWHGYTKRGLRGLVRLQQWAHAPCFAQILALEKLEKALLGVIRYLETNIDPLPNYGQRYRAGQRISTGFTGSAVNEMVAKRMTKKQQMSWNRHTVQPFLEVRIPVLNNTLEDAFRHWHRGFRPKAEQSDSAAAA
jgi:hypothetical protein